jgi:hypothetical protein
MDDAKDAPIYSTRADDPAVGEIIDAFVIDLARRVDDLQDCEARGDFAILAEEIESVRAEAAQAGFDSLAEVARQIHLACNPAAPEDARKGLIEFTEVARRIRLGHRGAA